MLTSTHAHSDSAHAVAAQRPRHAEPTRARPLARGGATARSRCVDVGKKHKRWQTGKSSNADTIVSDDTRFAARKERCLWTKPVLRGFIVEAGEQVGVGSGR
jgi:hypothetical protein